MPAGDARDRLAQKLQTLPSIDRVWANGQTEGVDPIPPELAGAKVNVSVLRGPTRRSDAGTHYIRTFDIFCEFPALQRADVEQLIDALDDEMLAEFADGVFLGAPGTYLDVVYTGADRPATKRLARVSWWTWTAHVDVRERYPEATP